MGWFEPPTYVLLVLFVGLALFLTERLRYDLIALSIVLALALGGALAPAEALAGFASEPVVVVAALSLFGQVLTRAGVGDAVTRRLVAVRGSEAGLVLRIVLASAALASLLSDVAVVAILLPVVSAAARAREVSAARYLLAVSYGAFLGDLLLVVGSAKNLAVNGVLATHGAAPFGVFGFFHFGLIVLAAGALWLAGPGRLLLPRGSAPVVPGRAKPVWTCEIAVDGVSTLVNRHASELARLAELGLEVLGVARGEATRWVPAPESGRLQPGDALIVRGPAEAILRARVDLGLARPQPTGAHVVEAIVPPGSELVGGELPSLETSERHGARILAIAPANDVGSVRPRAMRLHAGDVLLLTAGVEDLEAARADGLFVVASRVRPPELDREAWIAVGLLCAVLALPLTGLVPLHLAALAGAVGLVALRCVRADEAWRMVDWPVVALLGGMLALGRAFELHGLAEGAAEWLVAQLGARAGPQVVLGLLLVGATLLAQTTTSIATAVILTPVALSLAAGLGVSDRPFVLAVLTGTNCAFLSPVAHPAGAMIVGSGGLRFRDFLRAGAPLTAVVLAVAYVVLPWLWPFR